MRFPHEHVTMVSAALTALAADGMASRHVEEREMAERNAVRVEFVCSPPEFVRVDARDTVVVQELFRCARKSILIVTFALDERQKAAVLFGELAARMDVEPTLSVRVIANVHPPRGDERPALVLVREFSTAMRSHLWP